MKLKSFRNNILAKHFLNFIKRYGIRIHHNRTTSTTNVKEFQQIEGQLNAILLKGNGKKYSSLTFKQSNNN